MEDKIKVIVRARPLLHFEDEPAWNLSDSNIHCLHTKKIRDTLFKSYQTLKDQEDHIQAHNYNF